MVEENGIPITIVDAKNFQVVGRAVFTPCNFDLEKITRWRKERFGLKGILKHDPDIYAESVLSHGFMSHAEENGIYTAVQRRIQSEHGSYDPNNPEHTKLWRQYVKDEYLAWARQNHHPEYMLEAGWEAFVND